MKLVSRTLAFLLVGTVTFGSLQTPAKAADTSSEISSDLSSVIDDEEILFDVEDEAETTEDYEDKELDSDDDVTDKVIVDDEFIEEEPIEEESTNEELSDEVIPKEEDDLPEDFYTEYPIGGVIDEEPAAEIESVSVGQRRLFRAAPLAAEYITPDLPPLRCQNPYGTCWSFAATALAEINLMKNGYMSDPDMSELHLAYFAYNTETDPLGGTAGDVISKGPSNVLNFGGKAEWGLNTFARWMGVADESTAEYSLGSVANSTGLDSSLAYASDAHIVNMFEEPIEHDVDAIASGMHSNIKKLIVNCGAVAIEYYAYNSISAATKDKIYKISTNAYYNPNKPQTVNHAVVVVGWDDNFPASNFATEAPGDGAFLVRNSWKDGTGTDDDYTFAGYFWMSYYESGLGNYAYAAEFAPSDNYDNNYQYDGGLSHGAVNLTKAANVFTTHAKGGENGEILRAVSFYTVSSNVNYTIEVYIDLKDPTNPVSGTLVEDVTVSGTTSYAGMYTIELYDEVPMAPDTTFSVVITMQKNGANAGIGVEHNYSYGSVTAEPGQSFIYSGGRWKDLTNVFPCGNFSIKAYTQNAEVEAMGGVRKIDINNVSMINFRESFEYNGSELKQVYLKFYTMSEKGKVYLTEGIDYIATYDDDITNIGTKTVTFTGIGDYTGTITRTYWVRSYNFSRDADLETPCLSVSFEDGSKPDENGIYSFEYVDGGVFPEPQITFTSGNYSKVLEKNVDYSIKYYNNTEIYTGDDLSSLPRIAVTGKGNYLRSFYIYFNIYPKLQSKPQKVIVFFDGNGSTGGSIADEEYGIGECKELNNNRYLKKGCVFMGWALSKENADAGIVDYQNKEVVDDNIMLYCDESNKVILYAVWRSEFYINYNPNGGNLPEGVAEKDTYVYGSVKAIPKPVRLGYRFAGWFTDDTFQTQIAEIKSRTYGDFNLIAKWEPYSYYITYKGNGSTSGSMATEVHESGTPVTLSANKFERKGYRFVGWNTVQTPSVSESGTSYTDKETIINYAPNKGYRYTLYAQWEKEN